ncbi:hypothetical protein [Paenibacillus radicis (ex Gao et al. 2016)]|uniref:Uncharacterized protein n=1 Tax=Paenibacillus radicis (ex Gao et al. 2016) TaxID=1737354 RepID=A0A917H468_9BACL|nr:hypothetical protein [Paenibacillus radicis (ex Gao et al. 2016)]GGG67403.1 hypothetical protein GCM10010918_22540 [Paenibacillus radicis (ex Gao et al. 2016)]
MNSFVQYLDQFNVLSPSHAKIYDEYTQTTDEYRFAIDTKIENFLVSLFEEKPRSVIMTGNAGDGKTRLCRTVYERLTGKSLLEWPITGIVEIPFSRGILRIVKDLSELTDAVINEELQCLQDLIQANHSSKFYYLIAANEGKLTKFLSQNASLNHLSELVKERFLDHHQNDLHLHLANLQDITSSIYAGRIIKEWNREENWDACESCSHMNNCIIRLNHRRMSQESIQEKLIEQYRLLDCLGIHVTMREILIHISYVITGGLTCEQVLYAKYKDVEEQANRAYYDNFYGVYMKENDSGHLGAIRYLRQLDPGQLSISSIDDYLLNGDISGNSYIVEKHQILFDEEIDMLFGYYRKQIEMYRTQNPDKDNVVIFDQMPKFRRKYFFESNEHDGTREKLVPYLHFYRFVDSLTNKQSLATVRKELIQGLNHSFSKKLINRGETQLYIVNENLLIHESYSASQVRLSIDEERSDIDYLPSKLYITVNHDTKLEVKLPVFEYLLRLAGGGLFITLRQEVDILISTFKNDLINRSELDEYILQVFAIDPNKGVYVPYQIDI